MAGILNNHSLEVDRLKEQQITLNNYLKFRYENSTDIKHIDEFLKADQITLNTIQIIKELQND